LLVFGLVVTVAGLVWLALVGWNYVNAVVNASQVCSGLGYSAVACQTAYANESLSIYWMFAGIAVFVIGLWATARSFMAGEDLLQSRKPMPPAYSPQPVAPAGRVCPACKTWQTAPFCPNDGTKLG